MQTCTVVQPHYAKDVDLIKYLGFHTTVIPLDYHMNAIRNRGTDYFNKHREAGTFDSDLLLLTGGEDVWGLCYDTQYPPALAGSPRDNFELRVILYRKHNKLPTMGICRGSQILAVGFGGSLHPHVNHHAGGRHKVMCNDGTILDTNSYHHQAVKPNKNYEVYAKTHRPLNEGLFGEVESWGVCGLAAGVQWHPEWEPFERETCESVDYFANLAQELVA